LRARIGHLTTRLQGTWDGQGLLGRLSSASVVMVGGIAALGLALVAFVSAQGWPGGLTSPGFTPSQLIELAPGGGDTAVSDNRVAGRPPAPASAPTRSGAPDSPSASGGAFGTASRSSSGGSPGAQATRHRRGAAQAGHSGGVTPSASGAGKHDGGVPAHQQASRPAAAPAGGEDSNGNGHAYGHDKNGGPPQKHNAGSATDRQSPAAAPPSPAHKGKSQGKALGHSKSGSAGKSHGKGHQKG
jgi:hypothetical protein